MKRRFTLKTLIPIGLFVGLAIGYVLEAPVSLNVFSTPIPFPTHRLFETLPGAWMVVVKMHRLSSPQILQMTKLSSGRLTVILPGKNLVQILDTRGRVLFEQPFLVEFMSGEPLKSVDEVTMVLVLPAMENEHTLVIQTPNGNSSYEFPNP